MKVTRILAATDLSASGELAVRRAALLARQFGAELQVTHVTPDWNLFSRLTPVSRTHYTELQQHSARQLEEVVGRMRSEYGITVRGEIQSGTATQGILRAAQSAQPQLVVLGARGEHDRRMAPSALGGTALKLIAQLDQPILLVRRAATAAYRASLAAVEEAREVTSRVVRWAAALSPSDCHVVRAFDIPYAERLRACGISDTDIELCVTEAKERIERVTEGLIEAAIGPAKAHSHLVQGEALAVVLTQIVRSGAEVLVVGRHDHRPEHSTHSVYGSVGVRMAYHAPIDALLVP